MTKTDLLHYLRRHGSADAFEVAERFELEYPAAAMALLRLTRQSLAARRLDSETGLYWYELTEQGQRRLSYFESLT